MRARRPTRSGIAVVLALFALLGAEAAAAAIPAGPRIGAVALIEPSGFKNLARDPKVSVGLMLVDPSSGKERRLLWGPMDGRGRVVPIPFETPSWSADGGLIAFAGHDGKARKDRLYVVSPDGSGLRVVPGGKKGKDPVLSPDGHTLAFTRTRFRFHINKDFFKDPTAGEPVSIYSSTTTWVTDLAGGKPRRLTRWRNGLHNEPTSFSPDGAGLLVTKEDGSGRGPFVMRMSIADGATQEILRGGREAVYSPDGSRIAFAGYLHPDRVEAEENHDYLAAELYVAEADGTQIKRLSRTKGVVESAPAWDPSGQRLAYVQNKGDTSFIAALADLFPTGNALMQVNADGSCRTKLLSRPNLALYGLAWQPGPGREAGPVIC